MRSLDNVLDWEYVMKNTKHVNDLKVELKPLPNKGVGVVAKRPLYKNDIVALYKLKVFRNKTYKSPTKNVYCFAAYTKSGVESRVWICDLVPESLQNPSIQKCAYSQKKDKFITSSGECKGKDKCYVPFWAYFSNEPSPSQKPNSWIDMNTEENYSKRKKLKEGDYVVYKLVATKTILPGEEIVWDYGAGYGKRDYETYKS